MGNENEIIFEDLRGVVEERPMTVDLDNDLKEEGITPGKERKQELEPEDDEPDDLSASEEEEEPQEEEEEEDYSKRVKARIEREARAKRAAKAEAETAMAERDYWKAQAANLHKQSFSQAEVQLKRSVEEAEAALKVLDVELEAAIENGNTKDQVRLTNKLTDLKAQKITAEIGLRDLPKDGEIPPFDGKVTPRSPKQPSKADKWMDSRNDWYGKKGFERQTRLANMIDKEVFSAGYDPATDEYFEELDRRIKVKEPTLYDDLLDDSNTQRTTKRPLRSPVAAVDGGNAGVQRKSGNKVELTEADFRNMKRFNLDTKDPNVLKEYARNKREGVQ